jgi:hypothetical protein
MPKKINLRGFDAIQRGRVIDVIVAYQDAYQLEFPDPSELDTQTERQNTVGPIDRKGLWARFLRITENLANDAQGGKVYKLEDIKAELKQSAYELYETFNHYLLDFCKKIGVTLQTLGARNHETYDEYVVVIKLLIRLVAGMLEYNARAPNDGKKLFNIYAKFIENLINRNIFLTVGLFDSLYNKGEMLIMLAMLNSDDSNNSWKICFRECISSQTMQAKHRDTLHDISLKLNDYSTRLKQRLLLELNKSGLTSKGEYEDFLAENVCWVLKTLENEVIERNRDQIQALTDFTANHSMTEKISAMTRHLSDMRANDSQRASMQKITALYYWQYMIDDYINVIECLYKFIDYMGWMPYVCGIFDTTEIAKKLSKVLESCNIIIAVDPHSSVFKGQISRNYISTDPLAQNYLPIRDVIGGLELLSSASTTSHVRFTAQLIFMDLVALEKKINVQIINCNRVSMLQLPRPEGLVLLGDPAPVHQASSRSLSSNSVLFSSQRQNQRSLLFPNEDIRIDLGLVMVSTCHHNERGSYPCILVEYFKNDSHSICSYSFLPDNNELSLLGTGAGKVSRTQLDEENMPSDKDALINLLGIENDLENGRLDVEYAIISNDLIHTLILNMEKDFTNPPGYAHRTEKVLFSFFSPTSQNTVTWVKNHLDRAHVVLAYNEVASQFMFNWLVGLTPDRQAKAMRDSAGEQLLKL